MKKVLSVCLCFVLALCIALSATGCTAEKEGYRANRDLDDSEPVRLVIAGTIADCKAMETLGLEFKNYYPNVTVVYEQINDYFVNSVLRMQPDTPELDQLDLFFSGGVQSDSEYTAVFQDIAFNLLAEEGPDLTNTFEPLSENFRRREDSSIQYSIPVGGEMRGMFINVSLLQSVGIEKVPANQEEFLAACAVLKDAGYVPVQGNPGEAAQWLMYPWVCNQLANAEDPVAAKQAVEDRDGKAVAELLREPLQFLYELCEKGYYDYKYSQTEWNLFNETGSDYSARFLLNIVEDPDDPDSYVRGEGPGYVAFMPAPMSYLKAVNQTKEDYESAIEYVFAPAPIGKEGGYVYLSPADGLAINKNSSDLAWAIEFMTFMFTPEMSKLFAQEYHVSPNVSTVFTDVSNLYQVPESNISHLGEVTYSWNFYTPVTKALVPIAKANKPDTLNDTSGKQAGEMIEFEWYLAKMENAIVTGTADMSETKTVE